MRNENIRMEIHWCRKCSKNFKATSRECPVCGDKMFDPASVRAFGMFGAIIGIGTSAFVLILVLLILFLLFFGNRQADRNGGIALVVSLLVLLIPFVLIAKIGVKQWKSGKVDSEDQKLFMSSSGVSNNRKRN